MRRRVFVSAFVGMLVTGSQGLLGAVPAHADICQDTTLNNNPCPNAVVFVNTPTGPEAIGPRVLVQKLAATVGEVRSLVARTTVGVTTCTPSVTNPLPACSLGSGGYGSGGCVNNGSCSNLNLVWNDNGSWGGYPNNNPESNGFFHGLSSYSYLVPSSDPGDGFLYDFMDTLSNLTSDGDSICIIRNNMYTENGQSKAISWSPTGHFATGSGGSSQTVSVSGSAYGVSAGYSVTYNASAGYLQGDIAAPSNGNGPNFDGSWAYGDDTTPTHAPSQCDYSSDAVEAGIAYRTPSTNSDYYLDFTPEVYYQKNT